MGRKISEAKAVFWDDVYKIVYEKYSLTAVQAVGKLSAFYKAVANGYVCSIKMPDNYVTRAEIDSVPENLMDFKYNSGFFFEHNINDLCEILPICNDKFQTLTYYGMLHEIFENFFSEYNPRGIDRIVPVGMSMDFTLTWDGHDLIREMSRKITII